MNVQIWIVEEQLAQLKKITTENIFTEDVFDELVEFTPMMIMEGQICVHIDSDKYIELTDKGLLLLWEPNMG
tara:strand:+ start:135 stop:350 length:216 start_codon:yes stop_codon:yes gene_type:complete